MLTMELIYFFCKTSVCCEKFCVSLANQFYAEQACVYVWKKKRGIMSYNIQKFQYSNCPRALLDSFMYDVVF